MAPKGHLEGVCNKFWPEGGFMGPARPVGLLLITRLPPKAWAQGPECACPWPSPCSPSSPAALPRGQLLPCSLAPAGVWDLLPCMKLVLPWHP